MLRLFRLNNHITRTISQMSPKSVTLTTRPGPGPGKGLVEDEQVVGKQVSGLNTNSEESRGGKGKKKRNRERKTSRNGGGSDLGSGRVSKKGRGKDGSFDTNGPGSGAGPGSAPASEDTNGSGSGAGAKVGGKKGGFDTNGSGLGSKVGAKEGRFGKKGKKGNSNGESTLRKEEKEKEKSISGFFDLIGEEDSDNEVEEQGDEDDEFVIRSRPGLFGNEGVKPSSEPSSLGTDVSYLSETRFEACAVSPLSLKAIKDVGYEKMTMVQEATLPFILKGKDVLAKARTGTGKTVAFLLPSIEAVIKVPPHPRYQPHSPINVLIVCPTRELATQAATEANKLVKYHSSIGVKVVIGGTKLSVEQRSLKTSPCQILVATPGRFLDHLENTAGFKTRLLGVKILVLDEADHLLDMGFRDAIEKILAAVPKDRQTLLFSATLPDEVSQICHLALKRDYEFINTVEEGTGDTHSKVRQTHLVAPLENQFSLLYAILKDHISDDVNYKVLVFCTTAMVTKLVAELLGELNLNVREIHSRKAQGYRTRISNEFRKSKGLILVTSDVSARGVDYPDVTLVIQVGLPSNREQYIHRLGRTGRKGNEGKGILVLSPWEESFLNTVKDLPITKAIPPIVNPDLRKKVERALSNVDVNTKEVAYQAWLGYYNSNKIVGRNKNRLVELVNEFGRSMGLDNPPAIPKLVLRKMNLTNVPGLRSK